MRAATIGACLLVACLFAAFGFWWKANSQATQPAGPSQGDDEITSTPDEDGPKDVGRPVASDGTADSTPTVRRRDPPSDEGRRLCCLLDSPDEGTRRQALLELGKRDDTDPQLLTEVLADDPSAETRAAAARGLARLKSRQALPELIDALDDEDLHVRTWAITAINNACQGVRFPYRADAPRQRRLRDIVNIRQSLTRWGVLEEGPGE